VVEGSGAVKLRDAQVGDILPMVCRETPCGGYIRYQELRGLDELGLRHITGACTACGHRSELLLPKAAHDRDEPLPAGASWTKPQGRLV
jgi:hypothetical protein